MQNLMSVRKAASKARLLGALMVMGLLAPAFQQDIAQIFGGVVNHGRIGVYRNEDGTVKLGQRNEVQSTNWSGYVLANFETGQTYASASASWTVPKVTYQALPPTCHSTSSRHSSSPQQVCFAQNVDVEYSASWVGIGGTCEDANCTRTDNTLIQLGTEQDAADDGTTQYYAWYEMLPQDSITISSSPSSNNKFCHQCGGAPNPVQPGDSITASLVCQANCEPGQSQTWLLTMRDKTQNWTWTTTVTYKSTLASVEWIQEAPTGSGGVLPLADFVTASFDPTDDGGMIPNLPNGTNNTVGPDAITLVDSYGETSQPSPVVTLDAFSTCWGDNPNSIAACPAP